MKTILTSVSFIVAIAAAPTIASASSLGTVEDVKVKLDARKFDATIPASDRLDMIKRLATRKCDSSAKSLEAKEFERACERELKRSVLTQIPEPSLKAEAKKQGIL
ncbi:hypothetical protein [Fretibacter rubidus]|uniref:hypothetical protein n=1 Tax=Fretibacter rubidus TaxID=570162 RepID=UPI00352A2972